MSLRLHVDPSHPSGYRLVRDGDLRALQRHQVDLRTHEGEGEVDPLPGVPPLPGQANPAHPKPGDVRGHVTDTGEAHVYVFMGEEGDEHIGWVLAASTDIVASELLDVTVYDSTRNYEAGSVVVFPDGVGGYTVWEALERTWEGEPAPVEPEWREITTAGSGGGGLPPPGNVGDSLRTGVGPTVEWRPNVYIQPSAPSSPIVGDIWLDSDEALDGTLAATLLRLSSTDYANPLSTNHALQIGPTNGNNLRFAHVEIQAAMNGAVAPLHLNYAGGDVLVNNKSIVPTAWTAVTFQNGWQNYGGNQNCQYRKIGDRVYLRGMMKSGSLNNPAFTLPVGFQPPALIQFPIMEYSVGPGVCNLNPDGSLWPFSAGVTGFSIAHISFSVTP